MARCTLGIGIQYTVYMIMYVYIYIHMYTYVWVFECLCKLKSGPSGLAGSLDRARDSRKELSWALLVPTN